MEPTKTNPSIEDAIILATNAHRGQKDLDGKPVILHPLAVGLAGSNETEILCGLLHDVVEDTSYTFEDLLEMGYSTEVVDTLRLLTHPKGAPYMDYIEGICRSGNPYALAVKLNDLRHNIARGKAGGHLKQYEKHTRAMEWIENFLRETRA